VSNDERAAMDWKRVKALVPAPNRHLPIPVPDNLGEVANAMRPSGMSPIILGAFTAASTSIRDASSESVKQASEFAGENRR
jgi:hypothetical protein